MNLSAPHIGQQKCRASMRENIIRWEKVNFIGAIYSEIDSFNVAVMPCSGIRSSIGKAESWVACPSSRGPINRGDSTCPCREKHTSQYYSVQFLLYYCILYIIYKVPVLTFYFRMSIPCQTGLDFNCWPFACSHFQLMFHLANPRIWAKAPNLKTCWWDDKVPDWAL